MEALAAELLADLIHCRVQADIALLLNWFRRCKEVGLVFRFQSWINQVAHAKPYESDGSVAALTLKQVKTC